MTSAKLENRRSIERTIPEWLEVAKKHLTEGRIKSSVQLKEPNCIDGRTKKEQIVNREGQKEVLLRPGGAAGISLMLLGLNYSVAVAYESVAQFLQTKNMRYGWHTDDYSMEDVESETILGESETHRGISLEGKHQEELVLVVTKSNGWSVLPSVGGSSAFVYDQAEDEKLLAEFASWFNNTYRKVHTDLAELHFDSLEKIRDRQDSVTLKLLAQGKPVIGVEFDKEGLAEVKFLYFVQPLTAKEEDWLQEKEDETEYPFRKYRYKINKQPTTGCGHLQRAINNPKLYGVTRQAVLDLYKLIKEKTLASLPKKSR